MSSNRFETGRRAGAHRGPRPAYDSLVVHDAAWHARTFRVLSGALGLWGVAATVAPDPEDASGFLIVPRAGAAIRVSHGAHGWTVTLRDPASGEAAGPDRHAGLPGLLRRLREALAPDAPAGRLVIGAQQLRSRDAGSR